MGMIEIRHGGIFPVERDVLFDFVSEPANWMLLFDSVVAVDFRRWEEPGDVCEVTSKIAGRTGRVTFTLRKFERPLAMDYSAAGPSSPDMMCRRRLLEEDGLSRLDGVVEVMPRRGVAGLVDRTLWRWLLQRMYDRGMERLGTLLSQQQATPT
jgi:hypothetical protein